MSNKDQTETGDKLKIQRVWVGCPGDDLFTSDRVIADTSMALDQDFFGEPALTGVSQNDRRRFLFNRISIVYGHFNLRGTLDGTESVGAK